MVIGVSRSRLMAQWFGWSHDVPLLTAVPAIRDRYLLALLRQTKGKTMD